MNRARPVPLPEPQLDVVAEPGAPREPRIAVEAQDRAPDAGFGAHAGGQPLQPGSQLDHERASGLQQQGLVFSSMLLEPVAPVVGGQLGQEAERGSGEASESRSRERERMTSSVHGTSGADDEERRR